MAYYPNGTLLIYKEAFGNSNLANFRAVIDCTMPPTPTPTPDRTPTGPSIISGVDPRILQLSIMISLLVTGISFSLILLYRRYVKRIVSRERRKRLLPELRPW